LTMLYFCAIIMAIFNEGGIILWKIIEDLVGQIYLLR